MINKFLISSLFVLCFCVFGFAQDVDPSVSVDETPIRFLARPPAPYTDLARRKFEQGYVTLKVTFLASGQIGDITVVSGLGYGLTEQAVAAAGKMRFEPATKNGQPITVSKTVKYRFVIYFSEQIADLKTKAKILEQPKAEYPADENFKTMRGTVKLRVTLTSFGEIEVKVLSSNLPQAFDKKAIEAARKIKYEPAVLNTGQKITIDREIKYEFKPEN